MTSHQLKQLPLESRPRERLARHGSEALSTVELLAILLGNGTRNRSVLTLAADLLGQFHTLQKLSEATLSELSSVKGIGLAKSVQLQAAFALMRRALPQEELLYPALKSPTQAFTLAAPELSAQPVEMILLLLRDVRQRCIHREMIGKGTLTEVVLHPREIFHIAIRHRAHSLIIAHNHPSGDPSPSTQDLEITRILIATGNIVGIALSDHLIIGRRSYLSFCKQLSPEGESFIVRQ